MKEEEISNLDDNAPNPPEGTQSSQQEKKYKFSIAEKWSDIMKGIKEKTGINGIYVISFLLMCIILVYLGIFESLITNMVGTLYPGFSTIKAIEKKKNLKEWLTYWIIFGTFIIVDIFSNIFMKFIPFYFVLKISFLIWMFLPGSNGCKFVYNNIIDKIFKLIEEPIDMILDETGNITSSIIKTGKDKGVKQMQVIKNAYKVVKSNLSKARERFGNMEDARRAQKELEEEENSRNKVLRAKKGQKKQEDVADISSSVMPTFPKNYEQKYFKEELQEISNQIPEEQNEHQNKEGENKNLVMSDVEENKDNGKNDHQKKEEKNEEKKPEEKKQEEKKPEEKKEEKKKPEENDNDDDSLNDEKFSNALNEINGEKKTDKLVEGKNNETKEQVPINFPQVSEEKEKLNNVEQKKEEQNNESEIDIGAKLNELESAFLGANLNKEQNLDEKKEEGNIISKEKKEDNAKNLENIEEKKDENKNEKKDEKPVEEIENLNGHIDEPKQEEEKTIKSEENFGDKINELANLLSIPSENNDQKKDEKKEEENLVSKEKKEENKEENKEEKKEETEEKKEEVKVEGEPIQVEKPKSEEKNNNNELEQKEEPKTNE